MRLIILMAILAISTFACADNSNEMKYARRYGADARIVLRCVDQDGLIVTNASVSSSLFPDGSFTTAIGKDGVTDAYGCFVMEGKTNGEYAYEIKKTGFYRTFEDKYLFKDPSASVSDGRWQPYGATNTVVLKRIVNPVAMYVAEGSNNSHHDIPQKDKPLGFDLKENDWVAPIGKGMVADFDVIFNWDGAKYAEYNGSSLTLKFNDLHSGVYKVSSDTFSVFKSPYHANTNAPFDREITFSYVRGRKASETFDRQMQENECLILRIRPRVDKDGNLVAAHYAKIYGPFRFGYGIKFSGSMSMFSYFNPNENDTNLEADTTKNLLPPHRLGFSP